MLDLDLMIIFNGFIRNYINFGLNKDSKSIDVIKQENRYFMTLGKFLGFSVINKKNNDIRNIEISWHEYEFNTMSNSSEKLKILREINLENDLSAIYNLIKLIKEKPRKGYIQILETSSTNRIDFFNKIILKSLVKEKNEFLIIYITRDVIKDFTYYNAYLFENSEITKSKIGFSSYDKEGALKGNFYIK
jgi:hypothetical protein